MSHPPQTVFVLGAGFTKAFLPHAPLLEDDYAVDLEKFKHFPLARRILELEIERNSSGSINIERLMTRLDSLMPYDPEGADQELGLLLSEVNNAFVTRIMQAKQGP